MCVEEMQKVQLFSALSTIFIVSDSVPIFYIQRGLAKDVFVLFANREESIDNLVSSYFPYKTKKNFHTFSAIVSYKKYLTLK